VEVSVSGPVCLNLDGEVLALPGEGPVRLTLDTLPDRLRWV
jgi:hypothetical protein